MIGRDDFVRNKRATYRLDDVGVRATRNLFPARALWLANGCGALPAPANGAVNVIGGVIAGEVLRVTPRGDATRLY